MKVQYSDTPYAHIQSPGPDEALRRARAALKDMAAKGSVRRSSVGLRLGKLGIRYSSTSVSFGNQAAQAETEASASRQAAPRTASRPIPQARAVGDKPETAASTAQAQASAQAAEASAFPQAAAFMTSLFSRARQRMADALLGQGAERDEENPLERLLRSKRGQATYAETLRPAPASGCLLSCAV